ncbi:DUF11 domain-containing protein [Georgenia faecalis]|uniref:DUF11 domain-containing protein n=1 Tax=Georgenia faecalis TaxID=2483799 RepID=UPI000FD92FA6|nr:DUF11 domain-containing protein [Georgenia faecalis]
MRRGRTARTVLAAGTALAVALPALAVSGLLGDAPTALPAVLLAPEPGEPRLAFTEQETYDEAPYSDPADVADAVAEDGAEWRTLAATRQLVPNPYPELPDPDPVVLDDADPSYSPDGTQVVFSADRGQATQDAGRELVVSDASTPTTYDRDFTGALADPLEYVRAPGDVDDEPAWSPAGDQIAFVRTNYSTSVVVPPQIHLLDLATGAVRSALADPPVGDIYYTASSPSWSPDGARIVFVDGLDGDWGTLTVLDVETGTDHVLAPEGGEFCFPDSGGCVDEFTGSTPAWSPDGSRVVYDRYGELWLLTLDGAPPAGPDAPQLVTDVELLLGIQGEDPDAVSFSADPAWSPDGEEIAFSGYPSSDWYNTGIYAIAVDGGAVREIVRKDVSEDDGRRELTDPVYQPWADLSVELEVVPTGIEQGGATTLTATVSNAGPAPARGVAVEIELPAGLTTAGALPATCTRAGQVLTCTVPVPPGREVPVPGEDDPAVLLPGADDPTTPAPEDEVVLTFTLVGADVGTHPVWGRVTAPTPDPETGDNVDVVRVSVDPAPTPTTPEPTTEPPTDPPTEPPTTPPPTTPPPTTPPPTDPPTTPPPAPVLEPDVQVDLEVATDRAWVGGEPVPATITVTNVGPGDAEDVTLTTTYPDVVVPAAAGPAEAGPGAAEAEPDLGCLAADGSCALGALVPGASRELTLTLGPVQAGSGDITVGVGAVPSPAPGDSTSPPDDPTLPPGDRTSPPDDPAPAPDDPAPAPDDAPVSDTDTAPMEVLQPRLRLLPPIAVPGEATLAYGVDFPPGAEIDLAWDPGITSWRGPFVVRPDGTLRVPVLIVPKDQLGNRDLTATSVAGPTFGEVTAPSMLVVPRTYSPPSFLGRG